MRNILLIEPNYKNKYPPIGLMKIATYHRLLGDKVSFFKGDINDLIINNITDLCINKLSYIDSSISWKNLRAQIFQYIKTRKKNLLEQFAKINSSYTHTIIKSLEYYKDFYWKREFEHDPIYDRIYITTLFTFYWKITINTINECKTLVKNIDELKVGGITATILSNDVFLATGIHPHEGLLNKPGVLDKDNDLVIDTLPLDYSLLDEIDYKYTENNSYYGYMTRGCIRKCSFCAVPTLEPKFNNFIPLSKSIKETNEQFGERHNLILMDNNVLASPKFVEIINDIKNSGFSKGAKYLEPNQLDLAIKHLKSGLNDSAYTKKSHEILINLLNKLNGDEQQKLYNLLEEFDLLSFDINLKNKIIEIYPLIKDLYNKNFKTYPKLRYVDFNQGVDARLIDEENIKLLSEIAIKPLRIAFDSMKYEKVYIDAVRNAAKYNINSLSNYLLYNENDEPKELYQRLEINIYLCNELNINIYSFPMKFHPITGVDRFNREYLGKHWNRKYIRAVQAVLNSTKGKIGKGESFFRKAFGSDIDEFLNKLLYMPEAYIIYRMKAENSGLTDEWWYDFTHLTDVEKKEAKEIIHENNFSDICRLTTNSQILKLLQHYTYQKDNFVTSV